MSVPSRILVVDDDPTVCELIQEVLGSADMESIALTDSKQAATQITEERFEAIFLDVRMPPPDGIELTRQVRTSGLNRTTPIVVITGEEDNTVLKRAFEAGASFFLFKPVDRHRMLRLIRVTEGSIQHEARRYQRVKASCKVSIEFGQERLSGTTLDLSLCGLLVRAPSTLPVGSEIQVSLELKSGSSPLRLAARVMRVSADNCMGLLIENAGREEAKRLQEFLLPLILADIH
jgi:CheY-like chemotaxis protein